MIITFLVFIKLRIKIIINTIKVSLMNLRNKIINQLDSKNNIDDSNKVQLVYEFEDGELSKSEIEFLLGAISKSSIDGNKLQSIFNLTLKLQYKLKKMED